MAGYIPLELITNILARLPVKDVSRCKVVCNSWYSLIKSSSFTSLHLKLSTPNQKPPLLMHYKPRFSPSVGVLLAENKTVVKISGVDDQFTNSNCRFIGSFNGLFCYYDSARNTPILWNPSLRKSLCLPNPSILPKYYWHSVGFAFLASSNDYKIVRFSYPNLRRGAPKGEIYKLRDGYWRVIDNADKIPYVTTKDLGTQAFQNDIVHWPANGRIGFEVMIGSFDMKTEKFGYLAVPSLLRNSEFILSTFQELLCLADTHNKRCSIWVMKEYGVKDSWVKRFNIHIGFHGLSRPLCFTDNELIVFESDEVDWLPCFVLFDPFKNKVINKIGPYDRVCGVVVCSYIESLVFGNSNKRRKKARLE